MQRQHVPDVMYLYAEVDGIAVKAHGHSPASVFLAHLAQHWPTRRWTSQRRMLSAQQFADPAVVETVEQELRRGLPVLAAHDQVFLTTPPEVRWFVIPSSGVSGSMLDPETDLDSRLARVVPGMALRPGHAAVVECRALAVPLLAAP